MKILLCPAFELAEDLAKEYQGQGIPFATVEAEYGIKVVKGTHATLAHHAPEFAGCPAPCNKDVNLLPEGGTILTSHLDLDTVGGCLALMGLKPFAPEFWEAVEFVDVHGPHHVHQLSEETQAQFNAYWAWNSINRAPRATGVIDITESVLRHGEAISRILSGDEEMLAAGRQWANDILRETEDRLLQENTRVRVFVTNGVFCSASYWSQKLSAVVPTTVVFNNKFKVITVACSNEKIDARQLVQSLWGPEAGGHKGIAGSPRGQIMTLDDFAKAVNAVETALVE